jgi:hypothetical protein
MGFVVVPGFLALYAVVMAFRMQPWAATDYTILLVIFFLCLFYAAFEIFPAKAA